MDARWRKLWRKEITLSPATVTTVIDRLEGRGLVIRLRSETDKRSAFIPLAMRAEHCYRTHLNRYRIILLSVIRILKNGNKSIALCR